MHVSGQPKTFSLQRDKELLRAKYAAERDKRLRDDGNDSHGRVCHYVLIFICTCSITAMVVCIFEHVQWRWELNDRLALG